MMSPDTAFALEIAAVVALALVIVVVVAAFSGACGGDAGAGRRAAVHDVERALGAATLMTYAAAVKNKKAPLPPPAEGKDGGEEKKEDCCVICLSEYAEGDEMVRVVPACGHFFHAGCGVDGWLREHRTCPICRGGLLPLPRLPPMPPQARVGPPQ